MKIEDIIFDGENGNGYQHYSYRDRFIEAVITETIGENIFNVSIHPTTDKGYRDPFEEKSFTNLNKAKDFIVSYMNEGKE